MGRLDSVVDNEKSPTDDESAVRIKNEIGVYLDLPWRARVMMSSMTALLASA
jgi:hypothetical protein